MPIKLTGSSSGSTTITAPATGGDDTIELSTALAAKVAYPTGGTDGQALVKSGTAAAWGSAGGLVHVNTTDFAAASSVTLNNIFTSSFTNYRVLISLKVASGEVGVRMRMRASGADASGANYRRQSHSIVNVTPSYYNPAADTSAFIAATNNLDTLIVGDLLRPQLAAYTLGYFNNNYADNVNNTAIIHALATAYDGLTLYPDSSTLTGTITVLAYAKA
jgi:hypothetical protein